MAVTCPTCKGIKDKLDYQCTKCGIKVCVFCYNGKSMVHKCPACGGVQTVKPAR
jgi:lipopolysaccharide biosynthesis regulator YciM